MNKLVLILLASWGYQAFSSERCLNSILRNTVFPLSDLYRVGVGHIRIPEELKIELVASSGSSLIHWLKNSSYGDTAEPSLLSEYQPIIDHISHEVQRGFPEVQFRVSMLIGNTTGYPNPWHHDNVGPRGALETGFHQGERNEPRRALVKCILNFPCETQGATIVRPWAGEYIGRSIQAPPGYATAFLGRCVYHRGDAIQAPDAIRGGFGFNFFPHDMFPIVENPLE